MLFCLMLYQRSYKVSSLFKILFSFFCLTVISVAFPSCLSFMFLLHPVCCFNSLSIFFSSVITCVQYFIFCLFAVPTVFIHSSPKFGEHLLTMTLNSLGTHSCLCTWPDSLCSVRMRQTSTSPRPEGVLSRK